jgi:glycosyltransferase involved in cell wall biosynthesis
MPPVFSIIIPVYNVENYIRYCVDSVLSQTFTNYECILVDDGSTDNSPIICDVYAAKHLHIKAIHGKNRGLSSARNVGIKESTGEYIVFLDSDDLFAANDALKNLYARTEGLKNEVIYNSNINLFDEKGSLYCDYINKKVLKCDPKKFYREAEKDSRTLGAAVLFILKKNFLYEHDLFFREGILLEDMHWSPRVIAFADTITVNHSSFYAYRQGREGSITTVKSPKLIYDGILILYDMIDWITNKYKNEKYKILFEWRSAQFWYALFAKSSSLRIKLGSDFIHIMNELYSARYLLLKGKELKYKLFYLLVSLTGTRRLNLILSKIGVLK